MAGSNFLKVGRAVTVAVLGLVLFGLQVTAQAQTSGGGALTTRAVPVKGFGVVVSIDQPEYWTDFMPPGVRVPEITMTLSVFNNSQIPVTFAFPTSQRYDFAITNSAGQEVWRWSDGKAFLQVLGSLTLNPGQSVTYREHIKFADMHGNPFSPDLYTLTGELTSRDSQTWNRRIMEGNVSFNHYYVY